MITKYSTYFQSDHLIVPSMSVSTLYYITDSFVKYVGNNTVILLLTKYLFMCEDKIVSLQNIGITESGSAKTETEISRNIVSQTKLCKFG